MTAHPTALLDAVAADPLPSRQDDRAHILAAIRAAITEHGGLLHASWVREHITRDVAPHMVGAVMSGYVARTRAEWTGEYLPNGGPSGNGAKPARVWRIPEEAR